MKFMCLKPCTHNFSFDISGSCLCVGLRISKQVNLGKENTVAELNVEYGWSSSKAVA